MLSLFLPLHHSGTAEERYVVVASVAVAYLLKTPLGLTLTDLPESSSLVAPEMIDVETVSCLRRGVGNGQLAEPHARWVIADLMQWPVDHISHRDLDQWA